MIFRGTRKIILIIIIMIIQNQKLISLTRYLLSSNFIIYIKKFINLAISSFDILNRIIKRNFREKFRRKFWIYYRFFFLKINVVIDVESNR